MAHIRTVSTASSVYQTDQADSDAYTDANGASDDEFMETLETTVTTGDDKDPNVSSLSHTGLLISNGYGHLPKIENTAIRSDSPQMKIPLAPSTPPSAELLEQLAQSRQTPELTHPRSASRITNHSYQLSNASSNFTLNTLESAKSLANTSTSEFDRSSPSLRNPSIDSSRKEFFLPPQHEKPDMITDPERPSTSKSKRQSLFRPKTPSDDRPKSRSTSRQSFFRPKTPTEEIPATDGPKSRSASRQSFFRPKTPTEDRPTTGKSSSRQSFFRPKTPTEEMPRTDSPRSRSVSRQSFFRPKTPTDDRPTTEKSSSRQSFFRPKTPTEDRPSTGKSRKSFFARTPEPTPQVEPRQRTKSYSALESTPLVKSDSRQSFRSRIPLKSPAASSPTSTSSSPSRPTTATTIKSRSRIPKTSSSSRFTSSRIPFPATDGDPVDSSPSTRNRLSSISKSVQDALTLRRRSKSAGNLRNPGPAWNNENAPPLPSAIPVIASRSKQYSTSTTNLNKKPSQSRTRQRSSTNPPLPVPQQSWEDPDAPPLPLPASVRLMHPVIPPRSSSRASETAIVASIMGTFSESGSLPEQRPSTASAGSNHRARTKSDWELSDDRSYTPYGDEYDPTVSGNSQRSQRSIPPTATNYPDDDGDIDDNAPKSPNSRLNRIPSVGKQLRSNVKRERSPIKAKASALAAKPATRDSFSKYIDDPNKPTLLVSPNSLKRSSRPPQLSIPLLSDRDADDLGIYADDQEILSETTPNESSRNLNPKTSRASLLYSSAPPPPGDRSSSEDSSRSNGARSRPRTPISPINLAMFRRKGSDDASQRMPKAPRRHTKSASTVFRNLNRRAVTPTRDEIQMFGTDETGTPYFVKKVGQGYSSPTISSFPTDQITPPKGGQRSWLSNIGSSVPSMPSVGGRRTPTSVTAPPLPAVRSYPDDTSMIPTPIATAMPALTASLVEQSIPLPKSVFEDDDSASDSASVYSLDDGIKEAGGERDIDAGNESDASSVDSFTTAQDHISRPVSLIMSSPKTSESLRMDDFATPLYSALENEQQKQQNEAQTQQTTPPTSYEDPYLSARSTPSSEGPIMSRSRPTSSANLQSRPRYSPPVVPVHTKSPSLSDFNKMLAEMETRTVEKLKVEAFRVASQENQGKTITPKSSSAFLNHDPHESPRPSTAGSRKSFWRSASPARSLRNSFSSRRKSTASSRKSRPTTNNFGGVEFIAPRGSTLSAQDSDDDDGYHDEEKALGARDLWGGGRERKNSSEMYLDRFVAYGFS